MNYSRGIPNNLKEPPKDNEGKIFLTYYNKMEERFNKIEGQIEKCKQECVLKLDCKETRASDKMNFDKIFTDIMKELAGIRQDMKEGFASFNERLDKASERVSSLEVWRGFLAGGVAIIVISGSIIAWIIDSHDAQDAVKFSQLQNK